jgi:hypothetical protein
MLNGFTDRIPICGLVILALVFVSAFVAVVFLGVLSHG